jgi:nucleoid DNA-binding protein
MESLTRRVLVDRLRARLGLSAREAGAVLDDFLEILAGQLAAGGAVSFRGLGRFETRLSPPRQGRNPATGEPVPIPARRRPVFILSPDLRRRLT